MSPSRLPFFLVALSLPVMVVAACASEAATSPGPTDAGAPLASVDAAAATDAADAAPRTFTLRFAGRVGDAPFACDRTYPGLGTTGATAAAGDLRFFVHDVVLLRADTGAAVPLALTTSEWQTPDVALLDFEDHTGTCTEGTAGTNSVVTGIAPAGTYSGVAFSIGVPQALNHINTAVAPPPLSTSRLQWTWALGFLHLSFAFQATDRTTDDAGVHAALPFYAHVGSTGCHGDVATGGTICARPDRPRITLASFAPDTDTIVVDAKALYAGVDLAKNTADTSAGCMSDANDPECAPIFAALGLDLTTGMPTGSASPVFRVERP